MAKSTKHQDKIGSFDNFRAPWETESGEEVDVNKATLKRLLYNLKVGEAKAQDAADDVKADLEKAEADLETAKEEAASANGEEAQKKIDRLQAKVDSLTAEKDALVEANEQRELREEVLGDFAKEYPKAAKYVQGETREELEKSLEAVKEDFGISDESDDEGDDNDEDEPQVRTRPRTRLTNAGDRQSGKPGEAEIDWDKVAEDVVSSGPFR